ncbi:helix-turn-helix domain-containing protein [Peribacillus saganii]|uniref:Helix-turn-helix domain-containing protein n=1 Tax=Peribacillus saganii TaxID=2303992 RepID=A0A372LS36_9BACI|nr:helix-turn-helix transcriptional regulator [Peribacillus saganii]RFU71009.1 helix-turn-helix domain-containing protein [Peribacillus saganii]
MFGLGKKRTKFGKWLDREGITQIEIEEKAKLGRATVSRLCNDFEYQPKYETVAKVKKALKQLGYNLPDDYFGM